MEASFLGRPVVISTWERLIGWDGSHTHFQPPFYDVVTSPLRKIKWLEGVCALSDYP